MNSIEADLRKEYRKYSQSSEPGFLKQLSSIAVKFHLDSTQITEQWDAFKYHHRNTLKADPKYEHCIISNLKEFESAVLARHNEKQSLEETEDMSYDDSDMENDSLLDLLAIPQDFQNIQTISKSTSTPSRSEPALPFASTPASRLQELATNNAIMLGGNSINNSNNNSSTPISSKGNLVNPNQSRNRVTPSTSSKFLARTDRGKVVFSFDPVNPSLISSTTKRTNESSLMSTFNAIASDDQSNAAAEHGSSGTDTIDFLSSYSTTTDGKRKELMVPISIVTPVKKDTISGDAPPAKKFRAFHWSFNERAQTLHARIEKNLNSILQSRAFRASHHAFLLKKGFTAEEIEEEGDVTLDDLCSPTAASPEHVYVGGYVCDEDPSALRITEGSVALTGIGQNAGKVKIRLGHKSLIGYSLFPGQAIVVRGINSSGQTLVANALFTEGENGRVSVEPTDSGTETETGTETDTTITTTQAGENTKAKEESSQPQSSAMNIISPHDISIYFAQGPYVASDDLNQDSLHEILEAVSSASSPALSNQPTSTVLVLQGPFLPATHKLIAENSAGESHTSMFGKIVQEIISRVPFVQIILIPSTEDVHHLNVYPQPPFSLEKLGLEKKFPKEVLSRLHLAPNPCVLNIDGVHVAISGEDILHAFSGVEILQNKHLPPDVSAVTQTKPTNIAVAANGDSLRPGKYRLAYSASHILSQRCFYPIFPTQDTVPLNLTSRTSSICSLELPEEHIDVLIIPSKLQTFASVVPPSGGYSSQSNQHVELQIDNPQNTLIINPGHATRGGAGGTFAKIKIHAGQSAPANRTSVEIVKI